MPEHAVKRSLRVPGDFYRTPPWSLRVWLQHPEVEPLRGPVLEPSCGDGALLPLLAAATDGPVHAIEIDEDRAARARGRRIPGVFVARGDFLRLRELPPGVETILTNPPWNLWHRFVAHALWLLRAVPGGRVVMLLRSGVLQPAEPCRGLMRTGADGRGLYQVAGMADRPDFVGDGKRYPGATSWIEWRVDYRGSASWIFLERSRSELALSA